MGFNPKVLYFVLSIMALQSTIGRFEEDVPSVAVLMVRVVVAAPTGAHRYGDETLSA